jgi:hypothetical protein
VTKTILLAVIVLHPSEPNHDSRTLELLRPEQAKRPECMVYGMHEVSTRPHCFRARTTRMENRWALYEWGFPLVERNRVVRMASPI